MAAKSPDAAPAVPRREDGTHDEIPAEIPVLFLVSQVVYPFGATLVQVRTPSNLAMLNSLPEGRGIVAVAFAPGLDANAVTRHDLKQVGVAARVIGRLRLPDGSEQVTLQGMTRLHLDEIIQERPFMVARAACLLETVRDPDRLGAMIATALQRMTRLAQLGNAGVEKEHVMVLRSNLDHPARFADLVAAMVPFDVEHKQKVLEESDVQTRLELVDELLAGLLAEAQMRAEFDVKVKADISENQRQFFLRRQLKLIQEELGVTSAEEEAARDALIRLANTELPAEAEELCKKQIERLRSTNPASADFAVIKNHVDWLLSMPWSTSCVETLDLNVVQERLDADHYGLELPKKRILEHLAVHKLSEGARAPVLCFVGPPGVGKTSLAQSIASAIGRKLARISVGGVSDESEIRGHRRTYVGALPGRIIRAIHDVGCNNPLMVIDEIDKMGASLQGDPRAAMLEVLDPEQNHAFRDHYLDVPFDLSNVFFVTTANVWWQIPGPLRDRMEAIEIGSYMEDEKIEIAKRHLVPRAAERTGLPRAVHFEESALRALVRGHTLEAGVRQLAREIDGVFRKLALELETKGRKPPRRISAKRVRALLGPPDFPPRAARRKDAVGIVNGLAWTPVGGDVLTIEAVKMPGSGSFQLTGSLGDVMKESVQIALTFVRSRAAQMGVGAEEFGSWDVHVHFPEGATPKDGPSAGIAITTVLLSLFTGLKIRSNVAMTGEVTLHGDVLAIGGLKEKLAAAARLGMKKVLIPAANEPSLHNVRRTVLDQLEIVPVAHMDEVIPHALVLPETKA